MFPDVNKYSFKALKRFCHSKNTKRTRSFIEKIWDEEAINKMMFISKTADLDDLVQWLVTPDLEAKITLINNNINQFK